MRFALVGQFTQLKPAQEPPLEFSRITGEPQLHFVPSGGTTTGIFHGLIDPAKMAEMGFLSSEGYIRDGYGDALIHDVRIDEEAGTFSFTKKYPDHDWLLYYALTLVPGSKNVYSGEWMCSIKELGVEIERGRATCMVTPLPEELLLD